MLSHINRLMIGSVLMLLVSASYGSTITYTSTDQADVISGEDLWRYDYKVSGSFLAGESFNLLFDSSLVKNLQDPPTVPDTASWFAFVVQPDTSLPADGILNASALTGLTAVQAAFSIEFVRLGNGQPGSQRFEHLDSAFNVLEVGNTTLDPGSPVPIPGGLILFVSGLAWLGRSLLAPKA